MSEIILQCKDLAKNFDEVRALSSVNLEIQKGKVYGLIGRNGAGKTTLLKLMSGLLNPGGGQILFPSGIGSGDIAFGRGYDMKYFGYRIDDILKVAAISFPHWNQDYAEELIERFELKIKQRYYRASSGARTMTGLILSLAADAELLLLDEPYTGLDPINREVFYDFLRQYYFNGQKTVIISSHMIREIEGYFERTILIDKGQIILEEDLDDLKQKSFMIQGDSGLQEVLRDKILAEESLGGHYTYYVYGTISEAQKGAVKERGGVMAAMDLQTLMIKLLLKGGAK